jgi:pimeloyl-ACP methyl ester carboxylesterase
MAVYNGADSLYGTLLLPKDVERPPVVLIISGSGPTDRNGNQFGMVNNSLRFLAQDLALKGIASVRYDKRGVGKSSCQQAEIELLFEHYIDDAACWISELKRTNKISTIFIVGHSEGSLIGMVAAKRGGANGFISIAGIGRRIDEVLLEQLSIYPEVMVNASKTILDSLLIGEYVTNVSPLLYSLFRPSVQPYMISWLKYNPAEQLALLTIPVLIIQGTTDIQVQVKDAELLKEAKANAELAIIEGMNHVLKHADAERTKNLSTYSNAELPVVPEMVDVISKFILKYSEH